MSLLLDISGFEALFQVHYPALCATAYRIVQDKDLAEDIVQDVFSGLWERQDFLQIDVPLRSYLFRTTIDKSLSYIRKYRNVTDGREGPDTDTNSSGDMAETHMALKEVGHQVEAAVRSLPEGCRTVFILSRFEQLSYKEIAEHLDIPVKTVENQITKALKLLRTTLLMFLVFLILNIF